MEAALRRRIVDIARKLTESPDYFDNDLSEIDDELAERRERLVLVFDAVDRLADTWPTIRRLMDGLLRCALSVRSFRAIRFKIFIRPDQFADPRIAFPDLSKLKNDHVRLRWEPRDLYGLLFRFLGETSISAEVFGRIAGNSDVYSDIDSQKVAFNAIAGEFMGSDHRKGRTYTWVPLHLADAFDETSPRTFMTALREAASHEPPPAHRAIDYLGIRQGVASASNARMVELAEDYPWVKEVLDPLSGIEVPTTVFVVDGRWKKASTVDRLAGQSRDRPLALSNLEAYDSKEHALRDALESIGVIERRENTKLNIPDIFRVAAKIKRRGGVKVPTRSRR